MNEKNVGPEIRGQELREGADSVAEELYEQADEAIRIGHSMKLSNTELLPSELIRGNNITSEVKARISECSANIRLIIKGVAYYVEERALKETSLSMSRLKEGKRRFDQDRIDGILAAQGNIRLSYSTLKVVVEIFSAVNRRIVEEMRSGNKKGLEMTDIFLKNAIVIFELSAFVYDYLSKFSLVGLNDLKTIKQEVFSDIEKGVENDKKLQKSLSDGSAAMQESVKKEISNRSEIRRLLKSRWEDIIAKFDGTTIDSKHVADIRIVRDNMRNRIDILNVIATTTLVESAIQRVDDLADLIGAWDIPELDADAVKGLLDLDGA